MFVKNDKAKIKLASTYFNSNDISRSIWDGCEGVMIEYNCHTNVYRLILTKSNPFNSHRVGHAVRINAKNLQHVS